MPHQVQALACLWHQNYRLEHGDNQNIVGNREQIQIRQFSGPSGAQYPLRKSPIQKSVSHMVSATPYRIAGFSMQAL